MVLPILLGERCTRSLSLTIAQAPYPLMVRKLLTNPEYPSAGHLPCGDRAIGFAEPGFAGCLSCRAYIPGASGSAAADRSWIRRAGREIKSKRIGRIGGDGLLAAREARGARRERSAMSRHAVRARACQDRASLSDEITGKIIAELEAGRVPWVQPWGTAAAKARLPCRKTRRPIGTTLGLTS